MRRYRNIPVAKMEEIDGEKEQSKKYQIKLIVKMK